MMLQNEFDTLNRLKNDRKQQAIIKQNLFESVKVGLYDINKMIEIIQNLQLLKLSNCTCLNTKSLTLVKKALFDKTPYNRIQNDSTMQRGSLGCCEQIKKMKTYIVAELTIFKAILKFHVIKIINNY